MPEALPNIELVRAPELPQILPVVAEGQGLEQIVSAIVKLDLARQIVGGIGPHDLPRIAGVFIKRITLGHMATIEAW